jgi:hypothetical protein
MIVGAIVQSFVPIAERHDVPTSIANILGGMSRDLATSNPRESVIISEISKRFMAPEPGPWTRK